MEVIGVNELLESVVGPGYRVTQPYFKSTEAATVNGGAATAPTQSWIIENQLPSGNGLIITDFSPLHVDGGGLDFLLWAITQNRLPLPGYEKMLGNPSPGLSSAPAGAVIMPGSSFGVLVENWSGYTASGSYPASINARVQAAVKGYYFRYGGGR